MANSNERRPRQAAAQSYGYYTQQPSFAYPAVQFDSYYPQQPQQQPTYEVYAPSTGYTNAQQRYAQQEYGNVMLDSVRTTGAGAGYQGTRRDSAPGTKCYVGNLPWSLTSDNLRAVFEPYGTIVEATVLLDRETGRSRGFGFVTFTTTTEASAACSALDGAEFGGRIVRVNIASERRV